MSGGYRRYIAMITLIGAGLLVIGMTFLPEAGQDVAAAGAVRSAPLLPDRGGDAAAYRILTERPLFIPGRRMPPPAGRSVVTAAPPPPPPSVTLLGVMLNSGEKAILVRRSGAKEAVLLREGERLDGWTVKEVKPEEAVLNRGESAHSLTFPKPGPAAASAR